MYVFVTRDIYVYVHVYFVYICIVIYIFQAYNTPGTFMSSFASSPKINATYGHMMAT